MSFLKMFCFCMLLMPAAAQELPLIPYPNQVTKTNESFDLGQMTTLFTNIGDTSLKAAYEKLEIATSRPLQWGAELNSQLVILILDSLLPELGKEGYELDISARKIIVRTANTAGAFYALQTIKQLVAEDARLPGVQIVDKPLYEWRGSMLDLARSFFGLDYLKKHLDRMAYYKLNRLHLHLSDDQGWRIEIKSWPKLTAIGGKGAVKDGNPGFLTQKDYRELQRYAADRGILIIPEIDMPGHIYAALAAYPELNCEGFSNIDPKEVTPPDLYDGVQVGWNKLCLTDPKSYEFVADVIAELAAITDGPYFHMGGDEISDPLYTHFVQQADSMIRANGMQPIGWQETLKAAVDPSLIGQIWHEGSVDKPNSYIYSFCEHFYLDHANYPGQPHTNNWCKSEGVSLQDAYFQPENDSRIIGMEAAIWTEFVHTPADLENRLWPRLSAMAEAAWSTGISYDSFTQRLSSHSQYYTREGVQFYRNPEINWE